MRRALIFTMGIGLASTVAAQQVTSFESVTETQNALALARVQSNAARIRAERLEADSARVTIEADRTASQSAALAARIQQTQAEVAVQEANIRMLTRVSWDMRQELARQQKPLVELTAALQRLSRRPPALSLFRPGSLNDSIRLRAIIATILPEVQRRTAALRSQIARRRALDERSKLAADQLRQDEQSLKQQRQTLIALETRQRLESREVTGEANREADRALALAEKARDLGSLMGDLTKAGTLRDSLAALPGPVMRPLQPTGLPTQSTSLPVQPPIFPGQDVKFILPVTGRLVAGFGTARPGSTPSQGMIFAVSRGAQIVAPGTGRVAFAGPYRGYGTIVIIEHQAGWTSLLTGLAQLDTRVGARLVAGSPLGIAGAGRPEITLELRRNGTTVNPMAFMRLD